MFYYVAVVPVLVCIVAINANLLVLKHKSIPVSSVIMILEQELFSKHLAYQRGAFFMSELGLIGCVGYTEIPIQTPCW